MAARPRPASSWSTSARPTAPTPKAVRRYLAEFLSDPRIVERAALALVADPARRDPAGPAGAFGGALPEDLDTAGLAAPDRHRRARRGGAGRAEAAAARTDRGPPRDALWRAVDRIGAARALASRRPAPARAAAVSAVLGDDERPRCSMPSAPSSRAGAGCRSFASSPTITPTRATSKRSRSASRRTGSSTAARRSSCCRSTAFRSAMSTRAIRISANARRPRAACASGSICARTMSSSRSSRASAASRG